MQDELIRLTGVYLKENGQQRLRGVDFHIRKGEIVGLVGGFHSGKTAVVSVLEGTQTPERGSILIHGTEQSRSEECGLKIRRYDSDYGLIGSMTLWENMLIASDISSGMFFSAAGAKKQAETVLEEYGLQMDADTLVSDLPGSKRIAALLIGATEHGLDLVVLENIRHEYSEEEYLALRKGMKICAERGCSILILDVSPEIAYRLADRVCYMDDGTLCWEDERHDFPESSIKENAQEMLAQEYEQQPDYMRIDIGNRQYWASPGQILLIDDPELLDGNQDTEALSVAICGKKGEKRKAKYRIIDFSSFDEIVRWMGPEENILVGLSEKLGPFFIKPRIVRYLSRQYSESHGERLNHDDCEKYRIWDRIALNTFITDLYKPELLVLSRYYRLDQRSRQAVLSMIRKLVSDGTVIASTDINLIQDMKADPEMTFNGQTETA